MKLSCFRCFPKICKIGTVLVIFSNHLLHEWKCEFFGLYLQIFVCIFWWCFLKFKFWIYGTTPIGLGAHSFRCAKSESNVKFHIVAVAILQQLLNDYEIAGDLFFVAWNGWVYCPSIGSTINWFDSLITIPMHWQVPIKLNQKINSLPIIYKE